MADEHAESAYDTEPRALISDFKMMIHRTPRLLAFSRIARAARHEAAAKFRRALGRLQHERIFSMQCVECARRRSR